MRHHWLLCLSLICLICLPQTLNAQADLPSLSALDQMFTPSVTVTTITPPLVEHYDGISVYLDGAWHDQLYSPPLLPNNDFTQSLLLSASEGRVLISHIEGHIEPTHATFELLDPASTLIYDPNNDRLIPPEIVCYGQVKQPSLSGAWVIYPDRKTAGIPNRLCNLATGEISPVIPADVPLDMRPFNEGASSPFSEDGQWLINAVTRTDRASGIGIQDIFAYDLTRKTSRHLGQIRDFTDDCAQLGQPGSIALRPRFDGNRLTLVSSAGCVAGRSAIYTALLEEPESLDLVAYVNPQTAGIVAEKDRYLWTEADAQHSDYIWVQGPDGAYPKPNAPLPTDTVSQSMNYAIHVFEPATGETHTYLVNGVRSPGMLIADGSDDRLVVVPISSQLSKLIRFNLQTGVSRTVFTDDIGALQSVSPNGRYASVTLGPERYQGRPTTSVEQVAILDLVSGKKVFLTTVEPNIVSTANVTWSPDGRRALIVRPESILDPATGQGLSSRLDIRIWDAKLNAVKVVVNHFPSEGSLTDIPVDFRDLQVNWTDGASIGMTLQRPFAQWQIFVG